jgi:ABC-type sugar transport system ATPase subunit
MHPARDDSLTMTTPHHQHAPAIERSLVDIRSLSKSYGVVRALSGISLSLRPGEVHALIGENGAGKSTLINLLAGVIAADEGSISVLGEAVRPGSVPASEAAGIAVIHQESTAFAHLDAEDNLFVGREPRRCLGLLLDRPRMRRETTALLERLGERIDTRRPLGELPLASRQMVAIARALHTRSRLIIMDEPTASLSARESETLFRAIRQLRADGVTVLYVSHRLDEILALADRITVLRDGRLVETRSIAGVDKEHLIRLMVGRDVDESAASSTTRGAPGAVLLDVRGLCREPRFRGVSFTVRAGEIVGMAGLVGAGRSEVATTIFGADRADAGTVSVSGAVLPSGSITAAIRAGIALVPEDRQRQGLVLPMSVGENLVLAMVRALSRFGLRSLAREAALAADQMRALMVKAAGPGVAARTLSGGNQQKLVIGKWLATSPRVLILDEPTRGIDVGARAEIYQLIRSLAASGMATLVISSDLPEILALSDRILVLRQGGISGTLERAQATQERILALAMPDEEASAPVRGMKAAP